MKLKSIAFAACFSTFFTLTAFADQEVVKMTAHGSFMNYHLDNHYQLDVGTNSQGDIESFHFYGSGQDRHLQPADIMNGNEASNFINVPAIGNVIWIAAAPGFTQKDGGLVHIKFISSWGLRGFHIGTDKSDYDAKIERLGSKWVAYDAKSGAPVKSMDVEVSGQGTSGKATFTTQ